MLTLLVVVSELDEELMSTLNILEMALKILAKDGKILLRVNI